MSINLEQTTVMNRGQERVLTVGYIPVLEVLLYLLTYKRAWGYRFGCSYPQGDNLFVDFVVVGQS